MRSREHSLLRGCATLQRLTWGARAFILPIHPTCREEYALIELNERYVTNADGKRTAVILDIATFERLLDELEDLDDIRAIYEAKQALARGEEELIEWKQAKAELEACWATQE